MAKHIFQRSIFLRDLPTLGGWWEASDATDLGGWWEASDATDPASWAGKEGALLVQAEVDLRPVIADDTTGEQSLIFDGADKMTFAPGGFAPYTTKGSR